MDGSPRHMRVLKEPCSPHSLTWKTSSPTVSRVALIRLRQTGQTLSVSLCHSFSMNSPMSANSRIEPVAYENIHGLPIGIDNNPAACAAVGEPFQDLVAFGPAVLIIGHLPEPLRKLVQHCQIPA